MTNHYVPMARWLTGTGERATLTYPIWGYPLLLTVLPQGVLLILQVILGAATLAAVWLRLRATVPWPGLLRWVLLLAVPWYATCAGLWPMAPALCLGLLAVLALEEGLRLRRLLPAVLGGALLGVGLNFRSELLLWPLAMVAIVVVARWLSGDHVYRLTAVVAFAITAMALLVPWSMFYRAQAGHLSLTSSNGGMVEYISLGQLPNNPWQIRHDDGFAVEALRARGLNVDPLSDEGDRAFRTLIRQAIRAEPLAYLRKVAHNARNVWLGGFYTGTLTTDVDDELQIDIFREHCKLALGLNPNLREIATYRAQGVWDRGHLAPWAILALTWQGLGVGLGSMYLLVMLGGLLGTARTWRQQPILVLLAALIAMQIGLVAAIQYQPRHVNVLYVAGAPFVVLACDALRAVWRKRKGRMRSVETSQ
jgi:hypothetical protein